jgi:hypothetical protein
MGWGRETKVIQRSIRPTTPSLGEGCPMGLLRLSQILQKLYKPIYV